jgi:colanic acid/amylovoran biosynthesis glycosyltransferase
VRVAMFVGAFPLVSESFILRQITGLLDRGHAVDIFAERPPPPGTPVHPEVATYNLRARTTYLALPPESGDWELPAWPPVGRTWAPGAAHSQANLARLARAAPALATGLRHAPRLAVRALLPAEYGYQAASLSALYRLARLCRQRGDYDVLHAHFGPVGASFRFARDLWRAPLVVSFHGYDFSTWPRQHGAGVYRRLFATADALTANSAYTAGRLRALGAPAGHIHALPVGLDLARFPFAPRAPQPGAPVRLLTIARLVEIKGLEYAIRAVGAVRAAYPALRYDIVGEGPLRGRLEGLIGALGLQDVVTLHGAQDGAAVARHLARAHLFLLPSVRVHGDAEGQGLVLQEAQACGLPVIATAHGALPEGLAPGESGLLAPERDPEALAAALRALLAAPERWPAMGRAGRAFVAARYDIHRLNDRLVDLYEVVGAAYRARAGRRSR